MPKRRFSYAPVSKRQFHSSDRLDLEVQRYEGEDKRFQVLDKIIEDTQSLRIVGFSDIN
jgi:hypothetical protein